MSINDQLQLRVSIPLCFNPKACGVTGQFAQDFQVPKLVDQHEQHQAD